VEARILKIIDKPEWLINRNLWRKNEVLEVDKSNSDGIVYNSGYARNGRYYSETPIVGAFAVMVYGIIVLVLTGVGAVILAIRNRQKRL